MAQARSTGGSAIVTGGTGGLGNAVCLHLLTEGWRVVVPHIDDPGFERLASGAAEAGASDRLTGVPADLTDPASVASCVDTAADDDSAPLRAVINLVGGFSAPGRV